MYSNNKYKRKGFMMISAIMSMLIILMIAHGFMTMFGGQFTYLSAGKTAAQGQQFAELIGEKVKLEGIDAEPVTTKTSLETLTGNSKDKNWLYTYEISDGTTDENGNTFKVATIKVYKEGETSPRYTQEIPLSSLENSSLPIGSIIAWDNTADIPSDYLICNGSIFDAAVYPELKNILGSNKLPNMNTSLKANIDGYYATGYQNYRSNAHGNPVRTWEWGHKGQYNVSLTQHRLHFNSFSDGLTYNWNIKWIIKAK